IGDRLHEERRCWAVHPRAGSSLNQAVWRNAPVSPFAANQGSLPAPNAPVPSAGSADRLLWRTWLRARVRREQWTLARLLMGTVPEAASLGHLRRWVRVARKMRLDHSER